jgi:5-formyltetrahydrofolate cyclo-ligase
MSPVSDAVSFPPRNATRAQMRDARLRLAPAARIAAAEGVAVNLERLPEFLVDQRIAGYWAVGGELPLHAAVARLNARGQHYHVPIVGADRRLRFAPLKARAKLEPNRYGIPEPEHAVADLLQPQEIDLVLMPLTAFDRSGRRLGMGGGYYDRSFGFLRDVSRPAQPLLVGIGYSFQQVEALDAEEWDVALDYIATEKELIDCTPSQENAL